MNNWNEMIDEGRKYLSIVSKSVDSKRFSSSLLYNLSAIALEKYVMGVCMLHDYLPENHTLTDLITAVTKLVPIDKALQTNILKYEDVQMLCSIDDYQRRELSPLDLKKFIESVVAFCNILYAHCKDSGKLSPGN